MDNHLINICFLNECIMLLVVFCVEVHGCRRVTSPLRELSRTSPSCCCISSFAVESLLLLVSADCSGQ